MTRIVRTETKVCKKCGVEKPIEEFKLAKDRGKEYRKGTCLVCDREKQKLDLRKYRKHSGHKIQERHRERLANDPAYREKKRLEAKRKYERSKGYKLEYQRRYRSEHREQVRETDKNKRLKKEYGITLDQFRKMLESQGHQCVICVQPLEEKKAHIDHCHTTGVVRGVLCHLCNVGLGSFKDDPNRLAAAITYLTTQKKELLNDS